MLLRHNGISLLVSYHYHRGHPSGPRQSLRDQSLASPKDCETDQTIFRAHRRRFISRYAQLAAPITNLLRKNNFRWNPEAEEAFQELKVILTTAPVLVYPNFELPSVLETDACEVGVGAILLQEKHPVAYYSKKLSAKAKGVDLC